LRLPDFFVIGAPKCGTTALAGWLGAHPNVFMPRIKEPHYFNADSTQREVQTEPDYLYLFRDAGPAHLRVGEASVYYLVSEVAVSAIECACRQPRYIVMLRNPVEMAPALHEQKLYSGNEHVADFATAWRLQDERRDGRAVARRCRDARLLVYGDVCRLGAQLERLYRAVPRERVLTLLLDDLRADPGAVWRRTLEFLDLPDDGRREFPVANAAKERRAPAVQRGILTLDRVRRAARIPPLRTGIMPALDRVNRVVRPRAPLPRALRAELIDYFRADVALLGRLLARDLAHWLEPADV
jgi:hypothetical protein